MRVGFDLDGVGFSFHLSVYDYFVSMGNPYNYKLNASEPDKWEFYLDWGMTLEDFIIHCNAGADAGYVFRGNIRPGFADAVKRVKSLGHSVHIITDRAFGSSPAVSEKATIEWLQEHNIPYDTLDFSRDKTIVKTDMFVEDKLENYDALENADVEVYLINRPWNECADSRRRINCVTEYAGIIESLNEREICA